MRGAGSALLLVGTFLVGLVLLLLINTVMAQNSFVLQRAAQQAIELENREQLLLQQVTAEQSPEALQRAATRLGMVPVAAPVFLRLADGKVLGTEIPAQAPARTPTGERGPLAPADPAQPTSGTLGVQPGSGAPSSGLGTVSAPTAVLGSANAPAKAPVATAPKTTNGQSINRAVPAPSAVPAKPVKKPTATQKGATGTARTKGNPPPSDANLTETNRP
jgi:hypothetical protein